MTTSTIIEPTADLLAALAETINVTMSNGSKALKGYTYEPSSFDDVPAAAVGVPILRRAGDPETELEMGSDQWEMEYPVSLYFDLDEAAKAQGQMVEALEAFTKAIDADPSLGSGLIEGAKVMNAEPFVEESRGRPLCGYQCTVSVWRRNPY